MILIPLWRQLSCLLLACCTAAAAGAQGPSPSIAGEGTRARVKASFSGTVRSEHGERLPGVFVALLLVGKHRQDKDVLATVVTQGDGAFSFKNLESGSYQVRITSGSFAPVQHHEIACSPGLHLKRDYTLQVACTSRVTVTDSSGQAVRNAKVSLLDASTKRQLTSVKLAATDRHGGATIGPAPSGSFLLRVIHVAHRPSVAQIKLERGSNNRVRVTMEPIPRRK